MVQTSRAKDKVLAKIASATCATSTSSNMHEGHQRSRYNKCFDRLVVDSHKVCGTIHGGEDT